MPKFIEEKTHFDGLFTVTKTTITDNRGYFERLFSPKELQCWGNRPVLQVNRTFTKIKGTIRGLHFQNPPFLEAKFIYCIKGVVMDVALDLRETSKTFRQVYSTKLDEKKHNALLIPEGFAHGFQTLSDNVEILYFHSNDHAPMHEDGIHALDPSLNIAWQLPCANLSERDRQLRKIQDFKGLFE